MDDVGEVSKNMGVCSASGTYMGPYRETGLLVQRGRKKTGEAWLGQECSCRHRWHHQSGVGP